MTTVTFLPNVVNGGEEEALHKDALPVQVVSKSAWPNTFIPTQKRDGGKHEDEPGERGA
jgi:hypothetical protein